MFRESKRNQSIFGWLAGSAPRVILTLLTVSLDGVTWSAAVPLVVTCTTSLPADTFAVMGDHLAGR
jgi:hypothetical protein